MERISITTTVRAELVEAGALTCAGLRQAQAERSWLVRAEEFDAIKGPIQFNA
ncbi:hypothetical protein KYG_10845 [Acidovorax sp. NO-1]|nr:hypothetical protein KYG_10845 [Acidovorax sp. NO-1]